MDAGSSGFLSVSGMKLRLCFSSLPALLIGAGYVDPGKWSATIDGGARFGHDLVAPLFIFNLAAILLQYISACVGLVTGRNLAQICSDEYDSYTCILLGVQAELSMFSTHLTMIMWISHALNIFFGLDVLICSLLTITGSACLPLVVKNLDEWMVKSACIIMSGIVGAAYVLGMLSSEFELHHNNNNNGMNWWSLISLTKTSGENVIFSLMSLLGATLMPHNFYLHSHLVQRHRGASKSEQCRNAFLSVVCVFAVIFLVSCLLIRSSAAAFYNSGIILLTPHDLFSLVDQFFGSRILHLVLAVSLLLWNHAVSSSDWAAGISTHFFLCEPDRFFPRVALLRSVVPAILCTWNISGESAFRLLILIQILVAVLLPSSVIPLLRVASSSRIMGSHRIPQGLELLSLAALIAVVGLEIAFVAEIAFGTGERAGNLGWSPGAFSSFPHASVLLFSCLSFCSILWLAVTPLKSDRTRSLVRTEPDEPAIGICPPSAAAGADDVTLIEEEDKSSLDNILSSINEVLLDPPPPAFEAEEAVFDGTAMPVPDRNDEVLTSGGGSLSRLSGLGRAARRQLVSALDDFWGQLFDYHGQLTQDARARRLDLLFCTDTHPPPPPPASSSTWSSHVGVKNYSSLRLPPAAVDSGPAKYVTLQPAEELYYDLFPVVNRAGSSPKKYRSLPDISGLRTRDGVHADLDSGCLPGMSLGPTMWSFGGGLAAALPESELLLQSCVCCVAKLLKLEGSDWLFRQNDGSDEDLIGRIAVRQRAAFPGSPPPRCGGGCVWGVPADVVVCFGVWCVHRVLELSLMENRPELWGKYTYVLNRLQGVIEPAFLKARNPRTSCSCVQVEATPSVWPGGCLPPAAKAGRGKCTTASVLLDLISDVEMAISCRKGRHGTVVGDVAFPKGRENLLSVLRRYKRRLSGRQVVGSGSFIAPVAPSRVSGSGFNRF